MRKLLRKISESRWLPHAIFWPWNCVFLMVVLFGLAPFQVGPKVFEVFFGFLPLELFLTGVAVILIPAAATVAGVMWFRSEPRKLMQLFYGVEAPLFLVGLARLFLIRELTPSSGY